MANMYNLPEDLPTVTRQNYYEPSVQVENPTPPVPRRGYTPQDYERHRPAMIQRTAQKYLAPNGDFDQEGFNKEVMQNMYSAGDINGVRDFIRSQKENEFLQRASNKDTMDFVGNQAYSFSKTVEDIKSKQGEQAAQAYVQKYYPMLRTTMSKAGYGDYMSPEYDHDAAKLLGRQWATSKGKEFGEGMEVLSTPQLYTNPKNNRQEMWYFDKAGNPKSFVRTANKKDLEGGKSGDKEEKLKEILGPYQKWATEEPDRWAVATDLASEGHDRGLSKFQIQKVIGEKINQMDQSQLEEARAKKKSGGWGDFFSGMFGGKKQGTAPTQQLGSAKPMNTLPNPAQHKGKTIIELDAQGKPTGRKLRSDGKNWVRASANAGSVNLALNAEDVPLGTGMANQAKSLVQLRKELNDAYLQGDDQRAADIERQIQQIANQQRNVG